MAKAGDSRARVVRGRRRRAGRRSGRSIASTSSFDAAPPALGVAVRPFAEGRPVSSRRRQRRRFLRRARPGARRPRGARARRWSHAGAVRYRAQDAHREPSAARRASGAIGMDLRRVVRCQSAANFVAGPPPARRAGRHRPGERMRSDPLGIFPIVRGRRPRARPRQSGPRPPSGLGPWRPRRVARGCARATRAPSVDRPRFPRVPSAPSGAVRAGPSPRRRRSTPTRASSSGDASARRASPPRPPRSLRPPAHARSPAPAAAAAPPGRNLGVAHPPRARRTSARRRPTLRRA